MGILPNQKSNFEENMMKLLSFCFALTVLSFAFHADARSQSSLEDNKDYREFRKWVVASQEPGPDAIRQL